MTTGGSGFYVLTHVGHRLAYLKAIPVPLPPYAPGIIQPLDTTRVPLVLPPSQTHAEADIYEVFNLPQWRMMIHRYGPEVIVALQKALDAGELGLEKIEKSPTGSIYTLTYDLTGVRLSLLANSPEVVSVGGLQYISKRLRFTPAPIAVMTTATAPPRYATSGPTPASSGDEELPKIQVDRYALRTFKLIDGNLGSLYKETSWNGGTAVAVCKQPDPCAHPPTKGHRCGLYGTLTLDQLLREYGTEAPFSVAVFVAEGKTMLGTRGLRTHAARIVAYWCKSLHQKVVFDAQAPGAKHFEKIEEMLKAYDFPEYANADPGLFAPYDPDPAPQPLPQELPLRMRPPQQRSAATSSTSVGLFQQSSSPAARWAAVAPMMAKATPAGVKIVQELLGYAPSKSRCWNCNAEHDGPPGRCASCAAQFGMHQGQRPMVAPSPLLCGKCNAPVDAAGVCTTCSTGSKV